MLRCFVFLVVASALIFPLVNLAADAPVKAMDAYEHVQAARQEAGEIARSGAPADLRSAATLLEGALSYLTQQRVFVDLSVSKAESGCSGAGEGCTGCKPYISGKS
jgi:hypothetical protein